MIDSEPSSADRDARGTVLAPVEKSARQRRSSRLQLRFSLRSLMMLVTLCAVFMAWWGDRVWLRGRIELAERSMRSALNLAGEMRVQRDRAAEMRKWVLGLGDTLALPEDVVEGLLGVLREAPKDKNLSQLIYSAHERLLSLDASSAGAVPTLIEAMHDDALVLCQDKEQG